MRSLTGEARWADDSLLRKPRIAERAPIRQPRAREFAFVAISARHLVFIGTSANPFARLEALRHDLDEDVELAFIGLVTGPISEIRRHVWNALAEHDCGGRWYDVPPDRAVGALHRAAFKLSGGVRQVDPEEVDALLAMAGPRRFATQPSVRISPASSAQSAIHLFADKPIVALIMRIFTPTRFKMAALAFIGIFTLVAMAFTGKY